jgi:putative transposase
MAMDEQLDTAATGPLWLKAPEVAQSVSQVLDAGMTQWRLYQLHAWVVMSNHVHVLLSPQVPVHKAIMNVKSASARAANKILSRTGRPFWQDESYDHWVRNDRERNAIVRYIHLNPVKAGLVDDPEDWPWSSAARQRMALPHISPEH